MKATIPSNNSTISPTEPIKYVKQNVDDLSITLLENSDLANRFQVIETRNISSDKFEAEMAIIGASHIITFTNSAGVWQEVLACLPFELNNQTSLLHRKVVSEDTLNIPMSMDWDTSLLNYQFSAECKELPKELYGKARSIGQQRNALFATYPGEGDMLPFTGLVWEKLDEGIVADSIHAYPGDDMAVLSRSIFSAGKLPEVNRTMFFRFENGHSKKEFQRN